MRSAHANATDEMCKCVNALAVLPFNGNNLIRSRFVDDYVASLVRRELLLLYCQPDHPVVVFEDSILEAATEKVMIAMAMEFPFQVPPEFIRVLERCLVGLVAVRLSTHDELEQEERESILKTIVSRGFRVTAPACRAI